jgi:hypothetical protein
MREEDALQLQVARIYGEVWDLRSELRVTHGHMGMMWGIKCGRLFKQSRIKLNFLFNSKPFTCQGGWVRLLTFCQSEMSTKELDRPIITPYPCLLWKEAWHKNRSFLYPSYQSSLMGTKYFVSYEYIFITLHLIWLGGKNWNTSDQWE